MAVTDSTVLEDAAPADPAPLDWPLLLRLPALLAESADAGTCRGLLERAQEELRTRFVEDEPVEGLVRARARFIDLLLRTLWQTRLSGELAARLALVAVGGYGRGELHPCSDVDLLVLVPAPLAEGDRASVEQLVSFLWDIGLEVGHSVRTVAECAEESAADVGVMTTLMESRRLAGSDELVARDARGTGAGPHLAGARILRGQGARAAGAAAQGQRHRLQPRAERQDRPRRPARHPDHRLGRQAALRRRVAR